MNRVLIVDHVSRYFKNKGHVFKAVDDVSFSINQGEILALLGPNGAGKTTTVSMIGSYILPTKGEILINEQNIVSTPAQKRPKVGIVFGGQLGFYERATAQENLGFFADLDKIPYRQQKKEISRVLELVKLSGVAQKRTSDFSKGMLQRLHIARALLGSPSLLLLDEPTSGLDVEIAKHLRKFIKELANDGTTILLTSHTMEEVADLADQVILFGGGKIHYTGTVEQIINESKVKHVNRRATLEESYLALAPELRRQDE